jgi:hypothetical protein
MIVLPGRAELFAVSDRAGYSTTALTNEFTTPSSSCFTANGKKLLKLRWCPSKWAASKNACNTNKK